MDLLLANTASYIEFNHRRTLWIGVPFVLLVAPGIGNLETWVTFLELPGTQKIIKADLVLLCDDCASALV